MPLPLTSLRSLFVTAFLVCVCLIKPSGAHAQKLSVQATPDDPTATRGIELYNQGDSKGAIKLLRAVVKKQKEHADAWLYLGMAYAQTEEFKKGREALAKAHQLRPNHINTLNALTYTSLAGGDEMGAMQTALAAVKTDPQNTHSQYLLAAVNYRGGRFAQALEGAEAVLKLNPTFPSALYLKGQALLSLSDQAQANAGRETPDVRSLLSEKSNARFAEATQTLETFIRLAPNAPEVPKLREELTQMRLYRDAIYSSNPNRTIFAARDVTNRAIIQRKPEPHYTETARRNQVRGTVRLRLVLGADGKVQHIYATRKLPDGLTEASINAARKIKFIPATKDGRPVSQFVTIEYNFNIY